MCVCVCVRVFYDVMQVTKLSFRMSLVHAELDRSRDAGSRSKVRAAHHCHDITTPSPAAARTCASMMGRLLLLQQQVVAAFVTFNHEESMLRAVQAYKRYNRWCATSQQQAGAGVSARLTLVVWDARAQGTSGAGCRKTCG